MTLFFNRWFIFAMWTWNASKWETCTLMESSRLILHESNLSIGKYSNSIKNLSNAMWHSKNKQDRFFSIINNSRRCWKKINKKSFFDVLITYYIRLNSQFFDWFIWKINSNHVLSKYKIRLSWFDSSIREVLLVSKWFNFSMSNYSNFVIAESC